MNKLIEALLYIKGSDGLSPKSLSSVTNLSVPDSRKKLKFFLDMFNKLERGIMVIQFNDLFKFATREEFRDNISNLITNDKKQKLSWSAIETAGIIAYKQPITKSEINSIRGISSETVIKNLLVKKLIEKTGTIKSAGNPAFYKVSNKFYDYFNISSSKKLSRFIEFYERDEDDLELFSSQRED